MYSSSKNQENRRPKFPQDIINLSRIRDVDLHFTNKPETVILNFRYIANAKESPMYLLETVEKTTDVPV